MAMGNEAAKPDVVKTCSLELREIWGMLRATRVKECSHVFATVCTKEERLCDFGEMWIAWGLWRMRGAGLGDAPRTLLYDLAKIKSGDIVLPAETSNGIENTIRLRYVTEPDAAPSVLLQRLGLTLPRRLRPFDELAQI